MFMRIKALRKEKGLDQCDFAIKMGVSQPTISAWELETCLPKTRDLPLLAKVLGVSIGELFEDPDDPDMTNHITELGA